MKQQGTEKSAEVRGLEYELQSLRAQMRLQQVQAVQLAEAVSSGFAIMPGNEIIIMNEVSARKAYKLAGDVLS